MLVLALTRPTWLLKSPVPWLARQYVQIAVIEISACSHRSDTPVDQTDAPYIPINDSVVENAPRPVAMRRTGYFHLGSDRDG
jgi:hypothetical protein